MAQDPSLPSTFESPAPSKSQILTQMMWRAKLTYRNNIVYEVHTTLTQNRGHYIIPKILVFIRNDLLPPDSKFIQIFIITGTFASLYRFM